jgi:two-component system, chemotaxis family, CheB/CheR fusion protein
MLSGSETVGDSLDLFSLVDKKNKIYSKKMAAVTQWIGDRTSDRVFTNAELQISTAKKVNDLKIQKEVDRIVLSQYAPVGVTIDTNLEIVQFRGQTSAYLEPSPGKASFNLLKMAKPELRLELQSAIRRAQQQEQSIECRGLKIKDGNSTRQLNIHVLLSDIGMSEQDGYALIRQIRALSADAGGQIPAAAITAYAGDGDRQESIDAGFQLHLAKPVESNRLAWAVATLSGRI